MTCLISFIPHTSSKIFLRLETANVIREWIRVLRKGGKLILLLPDQQRYLAHCRRENQPINPHHAIDYFSAKYICEVAAKISGLTLLECNDDLGDYSFLAVFEKQTPLSQESQTHLVNTLDVTLETLDRMRARTAPLPRPAELCSQSSPDPAFHLVAGASFNKCRERHAPTVIP